MTPPADSVDLRRFGDLLRPEEAQEPILSQGVRCALLEWVVELQNIAALEEAAVPPRRKALLIGPPGVGKTTLAHHLCARVGLDMLVVRADQVIVPWVGQSDNNVGALFRAAAIHDPPIVLFFDEFDTMAGSRRASKQGADDARNSLVNTLLQRIEGYPGFLIAATNRGDDIDPAIWRRFDLQIAIDLPGPIERRLILQRYLDPYGQPPDALQVMADSLHGASPALMRTLVEAVKRQVVIGPLLNLDMEIRAVMSRVLESVTPPPDSEQPPLWRRKTADPALAEMAWPLPKADQLPEQQAVDPAGAYALGEQAPRANRTALENPFQFADPRRGAWDRGWREAAASDGLGPSPWQTAEGRQA